MSRLLLSGLALLGFGYLAVEAVRRHALRRGMLDVPVARSSHRAPTPRGGGVVIAAATLLAPLVVSVWTGTRPSGPVVAWMAGGTAIALVGWRDDVRALSSATRLAVQLGAAALVLVAAGPWRELELPVVGPVWLGWAGIPLAVLWIVGMTNAYNFMDGIDGIAAGQAVVAGLAWAAIGRMSDAPQVAAVGWAAAFTSAAFLLHNWSPARIFMGDVGSAFLGFTFAALPLVLAAGGGTAEGARLPAAAAAVVWPFLLDASATFVRRALRGEHVFEGHRRHLYQRLVIAGASHRQVATLYGCLAVVGAILALEWLRARPGAGTLLLTVTVTLFAGLLLAVRARERRS